MLRDETDFFFLGTIIFSYLTLNHPHIPKESDIHSIAGATTGEISCASWEWNLRVNVPSGWGVCPLTTRLFASLFFSSKDQKPDNLDKNGKKNVQVSLTIWCAYQTKVKKRVMKQMAPLQRRKVPPVQGG